MFIMKLLLCVKCFLGLIVQHALAILDHELPTSILERLAILEKQGHEMQVRLAAQDSELKVMKTLVHNQGRELGDQEGIIRDLLEWKTQQAEKERQLNLQLVVQRAELEELKLIVEQQDRKIEEQRGEIKRLQDHVEEQTEDESRDVQDMSTKNETEKSRLLAGKRHSTGSSILHRQLAVVPESIAFHAVATSGEVPHLGVHQKIIFDTVTINHGAGYHNLQGLFIAPTPGIYIFSTSALSRYGSSGSSIDVALVKNGATLAVAYASSTTDKPYDQGCVSVVAQLASGDEVWVESRYHADMALYGDRYTNFMGCLVSPL